MDVRQLEFLARQPSATLTERERFWGLPKRGVALLLANAMFWQPLWAQADGIAVSNANTSLGQAGNGVPIVNIAAPNASGLSHNQYQNYNVGSQGVILNNATARTQSTQLGGIIVGNPNLNGQAAGTILNEVTGANATQLKGYTEVAGQAARVIVANPYGVTCDGCGFINTPRVTLTTGKPVLDRGQLDHFNVQGGSVSVEGAGLNADNVDQFEIITRSARINAELHAKNLTLVTGRNDVNAQTLATTALADDGSDKPQLAIDSSALGGMYAGAIKLVGTEKGVGVRLAGNLAASAEDIQIDANGHLSMAQASANGAVKVKAQSLTAQGAVYGQSVEAQTSGALDVQGNMAARDSIALSSGGELRNSAIIEAGVNADNSRNGSGDVVLKAQSLRNAASVVASRTLKATVADSLDNQNGSIASGAGSEVAAKTLNNASGQLLAAQRLNLNLDADLNNQAGSIKAGQGLQIRAANLDNRQGLLSSDGDLTLNSVSLDNRQQGDIYGKGTSQVSTGAFDNSHGGRLTSAGTLTLSATQVTNQDAGRIASAMALTATVTGLDQRGGELFSNAALSLDLNHGLLDNQGGLLTAPGLLTFSNLGVVLNQSGEISSAEGFSLAAQSLDNGNGTLHSDKALSLTLAQALSNIQGRLSAAGLQIHSASLAGNGGTISSLGDLALTVDGRFDNRNASLIGDGNVLLQAASLDNGSGQLASKQDLQATIGELSQQGGQLLAEGRVSLTGNHLDNSQQGRIAANAGLTLNVVDIDNRGGLVSSQGDATLNGQRLDNSDGGQVISQQALALNTAQTLNRNSGLLSGKNALSVLGSSLDNSYGTLDSLQAIDIGLTGGLQNSFGLLSSEGTLQVRAATIINDAGSLSSAGKLAVTSQGALSNQGGKIATDVELWLSSQSLDNSVQGRLSGIGLVRIATGAFDNSLHGQLASSDRLQVSATQLSNRDGGSIGSQNSAVLNLSGLDNGNGTLFSNGTLSLDLHDGQLDNQGGLINSPGTLLLQNLGIVANQSGEISSTQGFTLAAQSLDNSNGKLLSEQSLVVRIAQALNNVKGMIAAASVDAAAGSLDNSDGTLTSRGNLDLRVDGQLRNRDAGLINARQALTVRAGDLDNQAGTLLGAIALELRTGVLDNRTGGLINSQGTLQLIATSLDSSNAGVVSAVGDMDLTLGSLVQNAGSLLGDAALTLDLQGGDLDNQNGLLTTAGMLNVKQLRDLSNQHGEISSSNSFALTGRTLDNSAGRLVSDNLLSLSAAQLNNQNGLLSGGQGLQVSGGQLDNRNLGTLSSRNGDLTVSLSGALLNGNSGALVTQHNLSVIADSLDNRGGILSSGAGQTLTVAGTLDNSQNGLIDSGAALLLNAMALGNTAGSVNSQQAFSFTGTTLDNSAGSIASNGAATLDLLGVLTNSNGKLASAGPLRINRAAQVDNQGGQLASQSLLTLLIGGFDNSNSGTVAAVGDLSLTATGSVRNDNDGLVYSQNGEVQLQAASLVNSHGTLQSGNALRVTTSGNIDNQSGSLIALAGDLDVTAADLDNRGGVLSSLQSAFTAHLTGVLKNGYDLTNNSKGGVTQAQRLNLNVLGGINNYGGRIAAQAGDLLLTTGDVDNRNGGLYAKGRVSVTGNNFDNSGDNDGQIAGAAIDLTLSGALNNRLGIIESDSTLAISAASLDNYTGKLRALGTTGATRFQIGTLFDNHGGTVESANTDLILNAGSFQNAGGSVLHVGSGDFAISLANVSNAGGSLVTRGGLSLAGDSWINSSVIQAGRLNVDVANLVQTASGQLLAATAFTGSGGTWQNDGLIASDGTLNLTLTGAYNGAGRATSLGVLNLAANQLNLAAAGAIAGGANSTLTIAGQLANAGRITSAADLRVDAGSVLNQGTLGAAQNFEINTPTLVNEQGLLFSGADMILAVDSFSNRIGDLYGLGNVLVKGYGGAARASQVNNISGSMESGGDFTLNAADFQNRTQGDDGTQNFAIDRKLVSGYIAVQCLDCDGPNFQVNYIARETFEAGQDADTTASSLLSAGRNLLFNGGNFLNSKSTVAAAGNIEIHADTLKNIGAVSGSVERTRIYQTLWRSNSYIYNYLPQVVAYNQRNNPIFPNVMYVDSKGEFRVGVPVPEDNWDNEGSYTGVVNVKDAITGTLVSYGPWPITQTGYDPQNIPNSQYDPNNLVQVPTSLAQYTLISDTEVAVDGTSAAAGRNAVIQAAGKVSITATQDLQNSVIHEDFATTGGASKVGSTQASGTGNTIALHLNAQLPPDLAQQQVNPVTLPGFSLPTGQNGLFRLSGQGASQATVGSTAATPQNWSLGSASISAAQRDQSLPASAASNIALSNIDPATGTTATTVTTRDGQTTAALLTVDRVQGVPASIGKSGAAKYLIETNPALTDLKQFMSSDYLLSALGYDPDDSAKRLGDGLYEQRLVQQAVVARTGQALIDGQTSNEAMYQYLMNNAVAEKDALHLSLGVGLSSEQVASLTHDIVWLEEHEVNGEKVLVPVLYLAQADGRLGPTGALIAGSDVNLVAGQSLDNVGTLRATGSLSATAGQDLVNSGLIQAGSRLDLLAGNNATNTAGGIISGRDVAVTAVTGDVLNERSVTAMDSNTRFGNKHIDYADSAARIEAANDLSVSAGRDIANTGGALSSGRDMILSAGRDVAVTSVALANNDTTNSRIITSSVKQLGASVNAGGDVAVQAGRDIGVVASQVEAKGDVAMAAAENLTVSSAADESHLLDRNGRPTIKKDSVTQVMSGISAGGDVALSAGTDLGIVASRVSAAENVSLDAGQDLTVASAKDEQSYYFFEKKKGSFGRSSSKQKESYDSTNIASVITAGNDLTINTSKTANGGVSLDGGRDVTIIGSELKAGNDLLVGGTGDVAILSGTEEHGSYSKKTKSGFLGLSKSGKSQLKTTATQVASDVQSGNDLVVVAGNDVRVRASNVTAANDAELRAGLIDSSGDINLVAANDTAYSKTEQYKSRTGIMGTKGGISFSAAQKAGAEAQSSTSVGSQVSADQDAILNAARDINIIGSGVSAGRNVTLGAGQDVNVIAGTSTTQNNAWEKNKSVGIKLSADRNGVTAFAGEQAIKQTANGNTQTAAASQLDAGQDLNINAGRDILQQGSDAYAGNDVRYQAGRNIVVDAAAEHSEQTSSVSVSTSGISATVNHNLGNTRDAVSGAGKGEDAVSQVSSVLKAVDGVSQFVNGPTLDAHIGTTNQSQSVTQTLDSQRGSTVEAGNDIAMVAGNDVTVRGSALTSGRDISIAGRDVTIDVAKGAQVIASEETQSKAGILGGTSGGFKVGVGSSSGTATGNSTQGTSSASQLDAGRDINLIAGNDLSLIGTQAQAQRDINLSAANDLTIKAAQNDSSSQDARHNSGGSVGIAVGQQGIGVYASVDIGRGNLDREAAQQQQANLAAGEQLNFSSGRDTTVSGATLRGDSVTGDVGRNLTVSSVADTGKVSGEQFDVSATAVVGLSGGSLSGSAGYGQTSGSTNWVEKQTSITAANDLNIRTQDHTQLDGALLASDSGKLKLDTGTLGFSDIAGKDSEHSYYLNVGGSYGLGGSSAQQDSSQVGKGDEGANGWSVSGYKYDKDREQIVRATVGAGDVVVRNDAQTGADSTAGLNRDVSKAYEITKDEEHRTDLYVTKSSVDAVSDVPATLDRWKASAENYGTGQIDELQTNINRLRAETITVNDVPQSARTSLGDAKALEITKQLVIAGASDAQVSTFYGSLNTLLGAFAEMEKCGGSCSSGSEEFGGASSAPSADAHGVTLPASSVPVRPYQAALESIAEFSESLPKEQFAIGMIALQAALGGGVKVLANMAANNVINAVVGDDIEQRKEEAAIWLVAKLTGQDQGAVKAYNEDGKAAYAEEGSARIIDGSPEVVGAKFLVESLVQAVLGSAGKAAGKVVSVSGGAKATGGAVELTFDKSTRTWTTPAGLDYGQGSVQGNRVLHVLEHAEPNPAKTTHSVFSMDRKEILGAVDEAWLKKGSPVIGDPGAYVVPMGRTIGTSGETSIKIIVRPGTSQVITAYPVK